MSPYEILFQRNEGYVSQELQQNIRATRLLIAGCGIGSPIAEAAVRIGFTDLTLADGDTVQIHNLNRQAYSQGDVGTPKVVALAKRLRGINPDLVIREHCDWITPENAQGLVTECDIILDTIDFLDIAAITAVHDEAHKQRKPVISAVSAGHGAAACYFPPLDSEVCGFRKIFGLPDVGSVKNASYVQHFAHFIDRIGTHLDPSVAKAMAKALTVMEDGTPCPAPHIAVGAYSVAALAITMTLRILNGETVAAAPYLIIANMSSISASRTIDLTP